MNTHLSDTQINVLVNAENNNYEYYDIKLGETAIYRKHIESCSECKNRYIDSYKLYKELNNPPAYISYKYVASILIIFAFGYFYFQPQDYSKNFIVNEELEELVGSEFRSQPLTVIQPEINENYESSIKFNLKMKLTDNLSIKITNNMEELIHEEKITSLKFEINIIKQPGLYYWTLHTPDDILYNGKFYFKKP